MRSKGPLRRVNNCINMDIFEMIKQEIMADPMNDYYTRDGISPLFKASENAGIAIVGQAPGRRQKITVILNDLKTAYGMDGNITKSSMGLTVLLIYLDFYCRKS